MPPKKQSKKSQKIQPPSTIKSQKIQPPSTIKSQKIQPPSTTQPQKRELPDMVKMSNPVPKPELLSTEPIEQWELVGDNMQYSIENMKEIILLVLPHIRSLSALLAKIAAKVSTLSEEFERIVRQFDIRYPVDVVKLFTNDEFLEAVFSSEEAKEMLIGKLNKKLPVQIDINKQQTQQKPQKPLQPKKQSGGRRRRRKGKKSV